MKQSKLFADIKTMSADSKNNQPTSVGEAHHETTTSVVSNDNSNVDGSTESTNNSELYANNEVKSNETQAKLTPKNGEPSTKY